MCSIFCCTSKDVDQERMRRCFYRTVSRGPDMTALEETPSGWMGFHRLAIMGLNAEGMQPFCLHGSFAVCNGELYGIGPMKRELDDKGYVFQSGSDSELILQLYDKWKECNKGVLAVRADRDEGAVQKFFANLYYTMMRKLVIKDMPKGGFDCYLLDRQVIEVLLMLDEKNSALTLQVLWVGFKSDKVYFHRKAREIGKSRWTLSKKIKLVVDSMMSFSYFPVRFMSFLGSAYAVVAVIMAVVLVAQRVSGVEDMPGWTSLMVVMLFSFGVIMVMLGLLGEYIWRALDASRNRPPFLIDETKGFDEKKKAQ